MGFTIFLLYYTYNQNKYFRATSKRFRKRARLRKLELFTTRNEGSADMGDLQRNLHLWNTQSRIIKAQWHRKWEGGVDIGCDLDERVTIYLGHSRRPCAVVIVLLQFLRSGLSGWNEVDKNSSCSYICVSHHETSQRHLLFTWWMERAAPGSSLGLDAMHMTSFCFRISQ